MANEISPFEVKLPQLRAEAFRHADLFLRNRQWKSEAGAVRAFARRHREYSPERCAAAFADGVKLYHAAVELVAEHEHTLRVRWDAIPNSNSKSTAMIDVGDLVQQLRGRTPGFPESIYAQAIQGRMLWLVK